jgi:hypothetical protein
MLKLEVSSLVELWFFMLKLEVSSLFGSRVACELARASSFTKQAKIVTQLVKKLIQPSRVEPSYERVELAHEFLAHSPALGITILSLVQATSKKNTSVDDVVGRDGEWEKGRGVMGLCPSPVSMRQGQIWP